MSKLVFGKDGTLMLDGRPGRFVWVYDDEPRTKSVLVGESFDYGEPRESRPWHITAQDSTAKR